MALLSTNHVYDSYNLQYLHMTITAYLPSARHMRTRDTTLAESMAALQLVWRMRPSQDILILSTLTSLRAWQKAATPQPRYTVVDTSLTNVQVMWSSAQVVWELSRKWNTSWGPEWRKEEKRRSMQMSLHCW